MSDMNQQNRRLWTVESYDLGGNSGNVIEAVFSTEEAAKAFVEEYRQRWLSKYPQDNPTFWIGTVDVDPPEPDWKP